MNFAPPKTPTATLHNMKLMRIIFAAVSIAPFGVGAATATDDVAEIAEAWGSAYRNLSERAEYHYRCTATATPITPRVDLGLGYDPGAEFALEIFRLGTCVRWHLISKPDFADMATLGWIQGFDGRTAYVVQCEGKDYSVYSSRFPIDELISRGQPFIDPLAGALGLSLPAPTGMVKDSPRTFGVEAALKTGTYRLIADDGRSVTVVAGEKDKLVLSREHGYTVQRRTWRWDDDRPIECDIVNSEWKQFADGQWYPAVSEFAYFEAPRVSPDPCLKVTFRFSAMTPSTAEDFDLIANRPGWTVTLVSPDHKSQYATIQRGEAIRLSQVASGDVPLSVSVHPADTSRVHSQYWREFIAVIVIVITLVAAMDIISHRRKPRADS